MNDAAHNLPQPERETDSSTDSRHADVLAAMDRIRNRKPGWTRAIILFVVSLTLFVGAAGAFVESLRFLGVLIAILLVHELGHFLAMRWFGYRNVRMFFIPFFGAAVSGQNFNIAGWKKVVVSLLGPLPGIGLGILLGSFAIYLKQNPGTVNIPYELLLDISTVSLVINGFNLLPILPLDGGWIMHALVFCRRPAFDAGFRLLAAAAMLLLGVLLNAWFFLFIGGFLLLGIPVTYRMAKLSRRLQIEGVQQDADPDGDIPSATATKIIDGVEMATGHAASTQIVATHALRVFETINATPPGIIASVLFALLHGLSLFAAIVAGFVLMIERESDFDEFVALALSAPPHAYVCDSIESQSSPGWQGTEADEKLLLIAHRKTEQIAADEFTKLSGNLPAAGKLTRFGQTLLVDVSDVAAHDAWEKQLQENGGVLPQGLVSVRVLCSLPSVKRAKNSMQDCEDYIDWFPSPDWLAPPWSLPDDLTAAGLERLRLARRTFQKVRDKEDELGAVAQVGETFAKEIASATLANNQKRIDELTGQLRKEQFANLQNAVTELRGTVSSPVEIRVLDLMLKHELSSPLEWNMPEPPPELADLLGRFLRDAEDGISHEDAGSKCFDVTARQAAFLIAIEVDSFESTTVGLTRLSHWLCKQGTSFIQYDITTKPDPLVIE